MERQTVVVKVGGSTLPHREAVLADLAELHGAGVEVVIAHGGGRGAHRLVSTPE